MVNHIDWDITKVAAARNKVGELELPPAQMCSPVGDSTGVATQWRHGELEIHIHHG